MKTLAVRCPKWAKSTFPQWDVSYEVYGAGACRVVLVKVPGWEFSLVLSRQGSDTYISLPKHMTCVGPFRGSLAVKEVGDELLAANIDSEHIASILEVLSDIEACTYYELCGSRVLPGDELFLSEPHQHYIEPLLCDDGRTYFMRFHLDPSDYAMLSRLKDLTGLPWYGLFGSCFVRGMAEWICEYMRFPQERSLAQVMNILSGVSPYGEVSTKEVSSDE